MSATTEALSHLVAETQWRDIPADVRNYAKLVMLDTIGVIVAGAEQPENRTLREAKIVRAQGDATVLARGWPMTSAATAALLNAIAGRSIELCESHYTGCQGGAQILPGALALSEFLGSTGEELLTAFIVGYDIAVRFCNARILRPLSHTNGHATLLGAVAAGARLHGFDAVKTGRALQIGATLMLTPSLTNAVMGGTALNVAAGMSGFASVLVPELAAAGFAAHDEAIEESFANLVGDGFRPERLLEGLGVDWHICGSRFRLRACCNPIYAALDVLEDALEALNPCPDEIEQIDFHTYRFASLMSNPDPPNYFAAKYSLPHAAAALIVKGHLGYHSFTEDAVHDATISALRHRVKIAEDPAMTARFPACKPARVTLTLKSGRQATHAREAAKRDSDRPYQESEIRRKFHELAGLVLATEGINAVEKLIDGCERWTSARELTKILRRSDVV